MHLFVLWVSVVASGLRLTSRSSMSGCLKRVTVRSKVRRPSASMLTVPDGTSNVRFRNSGTNFRPPMGKGRVPFCVDSRIICFKIKEYNLVLP